MNPEWSQEHDVEFYDFISLFYYSLVTLATIGYGDIVPKTNTEKVLGMLIMFTGVGFFSFIMGSFIEILQQFQKNVSGPESRTYEIDNWLKLLTRFRLNRPLPNELYKQILRHFKHYWQNNRLKQVSKDIEFLGMLPAQIKKSVLVHFLFDDIFYNFRYFFNPMKHKDSNFLYDVAYGLMPRQFSDRQDENIILDEEEEVLEMYFIISGSVGIGYQLYQQPLEKPRFILVKSQAQNSFFGDYYIFFSIRAEFVHIAMTPIEAFALSRKFLMKKIFPQYPEIYTEFKDASKYRYTGQYQKQLYKHKLAHIEQVNKNSSYHMINIAQRPQKVAQKLNISQVEFIKGSREEQHSYQIANRFKARIEHVNEEIAKMNYILQEFLDTVTADFNRMVLQTAVMSRQLNTLKVLNLEAEQELTSIRRIVQRDELPEEIHETESSVAQ